jgi:hypothetical protein
MPLSRVGFPNLPTRSAPIDVSAAFRLSGISRRPRGFWHLGSRRGFPALRWRSPRATVPLACSRRAAVRLRRQQSERFAFCGSPSLIGPRSGSPKPSPSRPRRAQGLRPSHPRDVIACSSVTRARRSRSRISPCDAAETDRLACRMASASDLTLLMQNVIVYTTGGLYAAGQLSVGLRLGFNGVLLLRKPAAIIAACVPF